MRDRRPAGTLVCGVLGVTCCAPLAVAAVFLGLRSRREHGAAGPRSAKIGFVPGWIGVALWVLSLVGFALSALR